MGIGNVLGRLWAWLVREDPPQPNARCPICGRGVVVAPTTMRSAFAGPGYYSPATREEKVAACPEHGSRAQAD
jgi:hypothetical protein